MPGLQWFRFDADFWAHPKVMRLVHLPQGRRIDHLLIRCGDHGPTVRITDAGLAVHEPVGGVQPSDHYGVFADLVPREGATLDTSGHRNPSDR